MDNNLILGVYNIQLEIKNKGELIKNDGQSVPFEVRKGDVILLMGQNGSGKTAFIEALMGQNSRGNNAILKCDKTFCGEPYNVNDIKNKIGYSENEIDPAIYHGKFWSLLKMVIMDYKPYGLDINHLERVYNAFCKDDEEKKQYWKKKSSLKRMMIGKCSGGQKKKFSLLKALGRKGAPLYVFDEPVNCLDYNSMKTFRDYIEKHRGGDSAFIIITHCKIFKNPTRVYRIVDKHLIDMTEQYSSYDCIDE